MVGKTIRNWVSTPPNNKLMLDATNKKLMLDATQSETVFQSHKERFSLAGGGARFLSFCHHSPMTSAVMLDATLKETHPRRNKIRNWFLTPKWTFLSGGRARFLYFLAQLTHGISSSVYISIDSQRRKKSSCFYATFSSPIVKLLPFLETSYLNFVSHGCFCTQR